MKKFILLNIFSIWGLGTYAQVTDWKTNGNSINSTDYIGTTNIEPFKIVTGNDCSNLPTHCATSSERMRIMPTTGYVGIKTFSPNYELQIGKHEHTSPTDESGRLFISGNRGQLFLYNNKDYQDISTGEILFGSRYHSSGTFTSGPFIRGERGSAANGNYSYDLIFGTRKHGQASTEAMRIDENGNLGLGQSTPSARLDIKQYANQTTGLSIGFNENNSNTAYNFSDINFLDPHLSGTDKRAWLFRSRGVSSNTHQETFEINAINLSNPKVQFTSLNNNIKVGINTGNFVGNHTLYVGGTIICEELIVKLEGNWMDIVFDEEYDLASLSEVEKFIDENHHLPGVPSAKEVKKTGIKSGDMDKILLQKIEELTLYIIEQGKKINSLEEQLK